MNVIAANGMAAAAAVPPKTGRGFTAKSGVGPMAQPEVWTAGDIEIDLDYDLTAGAVATAHIYCPTGRLTIMGEILRFDRELALVAVHIQTETMGRNKLGWARLRQLARAVAEKIDVDAIVIEGAARTTGATFGRIPRQIRFIRAIRARR